MLRICKICENEFSDRHPLHVGRPFCICGECAPKEKVKRHVGFTASLGKTDYWTEIVRDASPAVRKSILKQSKCGPGHCHTSLGLESGGATTPKNKIDAVVSKLYEDATDD